MTAIISEEEARIEDLTRVLVVELALLGVEKDEDMKTIYEETVKEIRGEIVEMIGEPRPARILRRAFILAEKAID